MLLRRRDKRMRPGDSIMRATLVYQGPAEDGTASVAVKFEPDVTSKTSPMLEALVRGCLEVLKVTSFTPRGEDHGQDGQSSEG